MRVIASDFDGSPWAGSNNFPARGGNIPMRGNIEMKNVNFRGSGDNWSGNSGGGMHCIHMRGLPFRATEQDIADVREATNNTREKIIE